MEGGSPVPERPPGYTGPAPPSGWQQPIARPAPAWVGKPLASWGSRVAATFVDWLVLLIPAAILGWLIVGAALGGDSSVWIIAGASALYAVAFAGLVLLYAPLLMMRSGEHNGQTLGKQALGIQVVRDSGEEMGFGFAALREVVVKNLLVGIASTIIPFLPWFLDNFWPLWDDENRALHDMVVSTHVVRT